jgi:uncharacterized protein YjlB
MFILKLKITLKIYFNQLAKYYFLQATAVFFFWEYHCNAFEVVRLIGTKQHLT